MKRTLKIPLLLCIVWLVILILMSAAASLWNSLFILWLVLELAVMHLYHQIRKNHGRTKKSKKEKRYDQLIELYVFSIGFSALVMAFLTASKQNQMANWMGMLSVLILLEAFIYLIPYRSGE